MTARGLTARGLTARGLTAPEAERRLVEHGPNQIPAAREARLATRVLRQLRDPMLVLLMLAGVLTVVTHDLSDGVIIAIVVVLNTTLGVVQEWRAARAVHELDRLAAPWADVMRDGVRQQVPARVVVPDDLLLLDAGDVVAADGVLDEAHGLQVDEAAITGESLPRDCAVGDLVEAGTVVTRGRGAAVVTGTGAASGLGRIAAVVASAPLRATPLQRRLGRLSAELVVLVVSLAGVVMLLGLLRGRSLEEMVLVAVSLSVAAVPESLPAVVSIALALGAHRMARRNAVVRRLPAVETLGSVTVLASDKTGTLTEGRMTAEVAWLPTVGEVRREQAGRPEMRALLRDLALCNDADLQAESGHVNGKPPGDPLERAMLDLGVSSGLDIERVRAQWPRVAEQPFDAALRRMATVHRNPAGQWLLVCKGAPEEMVDLLDGSDPPLVDQACAAADQLTQAGYRVLLVAERASSGPLEPDAGGLRLVGLIALVDPPRESAVGVVRALRAAGVRLTLVTGDHAGTARAVASRLGLLRDAPEVVEGAQLDAALAAGEVERVGVFARVRPEQKVAIVSHLQDRGEVVAVTGDGVNDAPALRTADIGVAMGRSGTEVARQAAALVLADDELRTVVSAVEEGRRVYANIRTFLRYGLAGGMAEVAVMLAGPFLGLVVPLLPAQILWVNMLTHGLPGVAFSGEPLDRRLMERPSRSPQESILGNGLVGQIAVSGAVIAVVSMTAGILAPLLAAHPQTCIFLTIGLGQLGVALALRTPAGPRTWRQRGLEAAVAASVLLQLMGVYLPALNGLLGTRPLPYPALLVGAALAVVPGLLLKVGRVTRGRGPAPR
ncbi:MAG TPA: cation-transporting P-type ATPase [Nocardioidaceae bacterium]|nr:cation-transporting P-type ATPase [Nocardioidaceae bacterium]